MVHIDTLDEETRAEVDALLERAHLLESRVPQRAEELRTEAAAAAGLDDPAALQTGAPEPGTFDALAEEYTLTELLDTRFLADEIETLERRHDAMEGRCPEHAAELAATREALEAVRGTVRNQYTNTSTWETLSDHVDLEGAADE